MSSFHKQCSVAINNENVVYEIDLVKGNLQCMQGLLLVARFAFLESFL